LWPDALIPQEDAFTGQKRWALPFDSTPARPLLLYLELCTHARTPSGRVTLRLHLSDRGKGELTLPLRVEVMHFSLPVQSSLPNSFGLSKYSLLHGHRLDEASGELPLLLFHYATSLLSHRVSAHGMGMDAPPLQFSKGTSSIDFSAYDKEMAPFLEGTALSNGARFTTTEIRDSRLAKTTEEKTTYYRLFSEHLRRRYPPTLLFFYAKDEPTPDDFPLVRRQAQAVHAANSSISVLVTSGVEPSLTPSVDILAPPLNCFFPRAGLSTCRTMMTPEEVRSRLPGRKLWWYQSCNAHGCNLGHMADPEVASAYSGWASYMVDISAMRNRAMGPLAYLTGIDGELYFDTVYAYNTQDPWKTVYAFGGNGDGTLFYPGRPEDVGGSRHIPIESLRLKHLRDGLEDYEYLLLAERLGERALARKTVQQWVRSGHEVSLSIEAWEKGRLRLSEKINERWRKQNK
jgi:hypothetical protein